MSNRAHEDLVAGRRAAADLEEYFVGLTDQIEALETKRKDTTNEYWDWLEKEAQLAEEAYDDGAIIVGINDPGQVQWRAGSRNPGTDDFEEVWLPIDARQNESLIGSMAIHVYARQAFLHEKLDENAPLQARLFNTVLFRSLAGNTRVVDDVKKTDGVFAHYKAPLQVVEFRPANEDDVAVFLELQSRVA